MSALVAATVEKLSAQLPHTRILLMTSVPPTAPVLRPVQERFEEYRRGLHGIASANGAEVVDIWSALASHEAADVLCADGYHLTAGGQEVVAAEIVRTLERCGLV